MKSLLVYADGRTEKCESSGPHWWLVSDGRKLRYFVATEFAASVVDEPDQRIVYVERPGDDYRRRKDIR